LNSSGSAVFGSTHTGPYHVAEQNVGYAVRIDERGAQLSMDTICDAGRPLMELLDIHRTYFGVGL
jgi:hypothetical protein